MKKVIIVAESGSDISSDLAQQYGIYIVPMHVTFDDVTVADGSIPPEQIPEHYRTTGRLPKTSGSTPEDFIKAFDEIHEKYPEAQILYLAYSAVTTCSYQSAVIAAEDRDYVTLIDTKQVSAGQAAAVINVAQILEKNPEMTVEEAAVKAKDVLSRTHMCFLPDNLEFLRAGGRVSNAAYLGSRILGIHPTIEILDGKLTATRKYRGKMVKAAAQLVKDYSVEYKIKKDCIWFVYTVGLSDEVRKSVIAAAEECGFKKIEWLCCNGVITTHAGPAAFGFAGLSE